MTLEITGTILFALFAFIHDLARSLTAKFVRFSTELRFYLLQTNLFSGGTVTNSTLIPLHRAQSSSSSSRTPTSDTILKATGDDDVDSEDEDDDSSTPAIDTGSAAHARARRATKRGGAPTKAPPSE